MEVFKDVAGGGAGPLNSLTRHGSGFYITSEVLQVCTCSDIMSCGGVCSQ